MSIVKPMRPLPAVIFRDGSHTSIVSHRSDSPLPDDSENSVTSLQRLVSSLPTDRVQKHERARAVAITRFTFRKPPHARAH
ncbi:hypothetical protein MRX96_012331 [Rhipicephalus microplus]